MSKGKDYIPVESVVDEMWDAFQEWSLGYSKDVEDLHELKERFEKYYIVMCRSENPLSDFVADYITEVIEDIEERIGPDNL